MTIEMPVTLASQGRRPEKIPPFPEGWFFVCYVDDLRNEQLVSRTFMGIEVVAFRDERGRAAVLDATCPHLGAHMGRGGCVKNGSVECPFHRFRFGIDGKCNHVPGAEPPRHARTRSWPVHEAEGLVMAYHAVNNPEPTWKIPEFGIEGWSQLAHHHFRIKGHPQETTENCVDSAHLITIHGYEDVEQVTAPAIEGAHLSGAYRMQRDSRFGPLGALGIKFEVDFQVDVWGLGHSTVQIRIPRLGLHIRLLTLSTPSDGEHIDLHVALRVKPLQKPGKLLPGLQLVPERWLTKLVLEFAKAAYCHDIRQDFFIWENKQVLTRPNLARNDGPVMQYRRYCQQFYPSSDRSGLAVE